MSFFTMLKRAVREPGYIKTLWFGSMGLPTNPQRVMIEESAQGLRLLYTANTTAEAGMLSQVLSEAGFYMEYVPSASTGIFGTSGNSSIYVRSEEYEDAANFLKEYLEGDPEDPDMLEELAVPEEPVL